MMKNFFRFFGTTIIFVLGFGLAAYAASEAPASNATAPVVKGVSFLEGTSLHECTDKQLKVKFLCNPDWGVETENKTMLIILSQKPSVTLTIGKSDPPVIFLGQLRRDYLREIGQYADGFTTEHVNLAGQEAIRVEGYSKEHPEMKFLDHYLLYDNNLYTVLFSVSPKEEWDHYSELLKKILDSFTFLNPGT